MQCVRRERHVVDSPATRGPDSFVQIAMADDDFDGFCPDCGTHFASLETLQKHAAAIHKRKPSTADAAAGESSGSSSKRPREEGMMEDTTKADGAASASSAQKSENIELGPVFGVLSDAQKDSLLLRAVQRDPEFYDKIEEQAMLPLTEEAAEDAVKRGGAESIATSVRWYTSAGVPANALTLLIAVTQKCLAALEALSDSGTSAADAGGSSEEGVEGGTDDELLAAVEALPAAGALGSLWVEALGARPFARCVHRMADAEAGELKLLLEGLQAAASTVRPAHPAVLVGPNGETVDSWVVAIEKLQTAFISGGAKPAGGGKAAKP